MTRFYRFAFAVAAGACLLTMLAGCTTEKDLRARRLDLAVRHFDHAKYRPVPDKYLTLKDCIELALKNNLDLKASKMEEDVANKQKVAELLRMLPEVNFNYTGSHRDNYAATSSEKKVASGASYGASTSQQRDINYFNLDFALSVMDFGLAVFNSQQAKDRELMLKQRNIRLAQNLILDVTKVYFNVAVYQRAKIMAADLLELCKNRSELISKLEKQKAITPFRAFEERKKFNDMERRLEYYTLQYENAAVELRSLLGFYATSNIKVDDSVLDKEKVDELYNLKLPKMEVMEQIALLNRPEMAERDIQKHINAVECHKIILSMFPSARLFVDFNASSNSYLYNQTWWDLGINAAINLMKLPMKAAQLTAQGKTVDAEDVKAYGQAITIMAQVRIAHADILISKAAFEQDDKIRTNYFELLSAAKKSKRKSSSTFTLSALEVDHMELQVVNASIMRTISLSNYYLACFRLMNAMGIDNMRQENFAALEKELALQSDNAEKVIREAKK
ncbi:MAG: TolC family protein [Lentisphaeria bacterium]|nr:TolC family protein [Lentisphaeria bacterium]